MEVRNKLEKIPERQKNTESLKTGRKKVLEVSNCGGKILKMGKFQAKILGSLKKQGKTEEGSKFLRQYTINLFDIRI